MVGDVMRDNSYYSIRTGKNPDGIRFDLAKLKKLFLSEYELFENKSYFQEAFGYTCVDSGNVPGTLGSNIDGRFLFYLHKDNLWPISQTVVTYSEDDIFDVIEFLYDFVSKPVDGFYHSYGDCGWHYSIFDAIVGKENFRTQMNRVLSKYKEGYELSKQGEILVCAEQGLEPLLNAVIPYYDPQNVDQRVNAAILKFRRHRSSSEDRRDAVRDLADVLEFLRPKIDLVLSTKDEKELFNIANNFGIRHHNDKQKKEYDEAIWYSWMFYHYQGVCPPPQKRHLD